jgi:hypothetical protein
MKRREQEQACRREDVGRQARTGAIQSHNAIGDRSRKKMPGRILQTTRNNARENFKKAQPGM